MPKECWNLSSSD